MASLYPKKIDGKTYWYLREMGRVDGKPKMISERYLGTAADIAAALEGQDAAIRPERTRHLAFGDVAAAWGVIQRLDVVGIVDAVTGGAVPGLPLSIGGYLAIAALNRLVAPCSKSGIADWWKTTAADRFTKIGASALDHRRFWDAMHAVTVEQLTEIEHRIAAAMIEVFDLDVSSRALDMTNFATCIDSANDRAPIAQRGKAKQKRFDLRLVGLGLVITRDGGIPLLSHTYAGNHNDVSQFPAMITELARRHALLGGRPGALTLVFDAGQNSAPNFATLTGLNFHYVGSLPPCQHPDLLAIPIGEYQPVPGYDGLRAHQVTITALEATHHGVLTHSASLHAGQSRGLDQTLTKIERDLGQIAATLASGRARRTRPQLQTAIEKIVNKQYVRDILTYEITGDKPATLRLDWAIDPGARAALEEKIFGKRILITDHHDWTIGEVIAGYRSQSDAEFGFRQLKDPDLVSFSPMHHFTDHNIRVHTFTCVLALQLAHLMRRHARHAGADLSVRALLTDLAAIEETVLIYPSTGGRPKARRMLTETTPNQRKLSELFDLGRWAPRG